MSAPRVKLREHREPRFLYFLSKRVRELIDLEIRASRYLRGQVETGGLLFAPHKRLDEIVLATGPQPEDRLYPTRIEFSLDAGFEVEESVLDHLSYVGGWHLHPNGNRVPSDAERDGIAGDLQNMAGHFGIRKRPQLGIIATFDDDPKVMQTTLHGWLLFEEDGTGLVCEPITLGDLDELSEFKARALVSLAKSKAKQARVHQAMADLVGPTSWRERIASTLKALRRKEKP